MKKTFESTQTAVRTPLKLAAAAAAALLILPDAQSARTTPGRPP